MGPGFRGFDPRTLPRRLAKPHPRKRILVEHRHQPTAIHVRSCVTATRKITVYQDGT